MQNVLGREFCVELLNRENSILTLGSPRSWKQLEAER